ncbi:MAG: lipoprotein ABC transporter [Candidatus Neomarinimicrobiota bacterium]|nr:MAG: lipoprotein ABC transporter [Candidatus Neomarinimicrobiota bacterium]
MKFINVISKRFYNRSNIYGKYLGILSMLGMGVGCFAIIISISVMNGFENIVHQKLKGFEGDIRVFQNIYDPKWEKIDGVKKIIPFMERKIVLQANDVTRVVSMKAVDEEIMPEFYEIFLKGNFPGAGEIILGQDLAYRLGTEIGQEVYASSPIDHTIGFTTPYKKRFKVSGVFSTKVLNYDDQIVFGTLGDGKMLFSRKKKIDGYDIKVDSNFSIEKIKKRINSMIRPESYAISWDEQNKSLVDAMKIERYATIIVLSLIFVVSTFNLISNLSLISIQKTKEIGILLSMGASKKSIQHIIMMLGIRRAGIGAFLGFLTGYIIINVQSQFSIIPLPTEVYFLDSLPMILYFNDIVLVLLISCSFIFIASFISGKKLSQIDVKEALQWVK